MMRCVRKLEASVAGDTPDSELSGAELRMKYSITSSEIENAKRRLGQFVSGETSLSASASASESATVSDPQLSTSPQKPKASKLSSKIDTVLLSGLDSFMSEEEQVYITDLMTSGEPKKLAQAAQILFEVNRLNTVEDRSTSTSTGTIITTSLSSLFAKKLSQAEERAIRMSMSMPIQGADTEESTKDSIDDLPPMPKHVVLNADFDVYASHNKVLKFKDDTWDGSLADAFARAVHVSNSDSFHGDDDDDEDEENGEEDGFAGQQGGFVNDGDKRKNRVLVTAARREAWKAGVKKGDVVTHVNMDDFRGTADDLRKLINNLHLSGDPTFSMVLNAEQSTADALKKRAKN